MKRFICITFLSLIDLALNAQIKVWPTTNAISIGNTASAPFGNVKTRFFGNTVFTSTTGAATSCAYIRGLNVYSGSSTPDYTWRKDSITGVFHPGVSNLGFTIAGVERWRINSGGQIVSRNAANTGIPDITWYGDTTTGIFHPNGSCIAFTNSGSEKMRIYNGNVGIGTTSPSSPLSVGNSGNSLYEANFYNASTSSGVVGVYSSIAAPTGTNGGSCVSGYLTCGAGYAYGIKGSSYNSSAQTAGQSFGVYGQAGNASNGYNSGVCGILLGTNNGTGVWGSVANAPNSIPGQYAGYFDGKIRTTNDSPEKPTAGSWTGYSDVRLKKDTAAFNDGLKVLRKIRPMSYKFNGSGNLPSQNTYIGVIAQQVETVAPYCVGKGKLLLKQSESAKFSSDIISTLPADTAGVVHTIVNAKTFNYDALIYVLINSVKQLDSTVIVLKKQLDSTTLALKQQLNTCCSNTTTNRSLKLDTSNVNGQRTSNNLQAISISNQTSAILYQNVPNPFTQTTVVKCFIPQSSQSASLLVFDLNGSLKKTIAINSKGEINTTINGRELVSGMYYYTLLIDGQEIDTKKMILTE